jgi:hypothetical protein
MNEEQYLLICLMEECDEVSQLKNIWNIQRKGEL